jgi:hypothetical protein
VTIMPFSSVDERSVDSSVTSCLEACGQLCNVHVLLPALVRAGGLHYLSCSVIDLLASSTRQTNILQLSWIRPSDPIRFHINF